MRASIRKKLLAGFALNLLLFVVTVVICLYSINRLRDNVTMTLEHPLTVTRAVTHIEVLVTAMHRSMKDVALADNPVERQEYIDIVQINEQNALNEFQIVQRQILGDVGQAMAQSARKKFITWWPIRKKVITLMATQKYKQAQTITREEGDIYVRELINELKNLEMYASNKAVEFNEASALIADNTRKLTFTALLVSLAVSMFIALILAFHIKKRLSIIRHAAVKMADGDLHQLIEIKGNDEFNDLADNFNTMAEKLKKAYNSLETSVEERTYELEQTNKELNRLKETLESEVEKRTNELNVKIAKLDKSKKAMLYMVEDLNNTSKQLKIERQKLEDSNKELEAFAYSVSHDLRAPLRQIQGFAEIIKKRIKDQVDEKTLRQMNNISEAGHQMGILIDDLLTYSRAGRMKINKCLISPNHLIHDMVNRMKESQPEIKKIKWQIEKLPEVYADRMMFEQVMQNLISNAIKFSLKKTKPRIEIQAEHRKDEFIFSVRDNGVGFNMEYVTKLFGVFQRLHSKDEFEGTGIGLANVQRIIHRHGGRVWAEGAENKGACFFFTLPEKLDD